MGEPLKLTTKGGGDTHYFAVLFPGGKTEGVQIVINQCVTRTIAGGGKGALSPENC